VWIGEVGPCGEQRPQLLRATIEWIADGAGEFIDGLLRSHLVVSK
jgi:hypothetical protein